jgi:hypothetical protein
VILLLFPSFPPPSSTPSLDSKSVYLLAFPSDIIINFFVENNDEEEEERENKQWNLLYSSGTRIKKKLSSWLI